jgi:hypothetical protein
MSKCIIILIYVVFRRKATYVLAGITLFFKSRMWHGVIHNRELWPVESNFYDLLFNKKKYKFRGTNNIKITV